MSTSFVHVKKYDVPSIHAFRAIYNLLKKPLQAMNPRIHPPWLKRSNRAIIRIAKNHREG